MRRMLLVPVLAVLAVVGWATPAFAYGEVIDTDVVLDNIWVLVAAVLVLFMQAGFMLLEGGLTRGKNVSNIVMKNVMDLSVGVLVFALVGFTFAFGEGNDFIGWKGFALNPDDFPFGYFDTLTLPTYFIFQVAFAATAATIVSGAMAERTKFRAYLFYTIFITGVIYPIVVHWTWGGGWLDGLDTPFSDFAGSTVVHSTGGWAALMGAIILGPRIGKYGRDGKPRAIPGHSIPMAMLGVLILFIGWFGFNPGSELAANLAVSAIAVTTLIAAAAGAVTCMATIWIVSKKPDVAMVGNGLLAGLVGITAGCASVSNWGAFFIGAIAGIIVVGSVLFFDRVKVDDPVGAISVHGVAGAWGTLAVGLWATDGGLFYGDGTDQLVSQFIGVIAVLAFVCVTAGILFLAIKYTIGLRVSEEEEMQGLDVAEHGSPGYNPDVLAGGAGGAMASASAPGAPGA